MYLLDFIFLYLYDSKSFFTFSFSSVHSPSQTVNSIHCGHTSDDLVDLQVNKYLPSAHSGTDHAEARFAHIIHTNFVVNKICTTGVFLSVFYI